MARQQIIVDPEILNELVDAGPVAVTAPTDPDIVLAVEDNRLTQT